jgi:uncharacterized protein (DUF302 family)
MSGPSDREVLTLANHRNVGETATLLARALEAQNITVFALIDQEAVARGAGLEMRPMILMLFGSSRAGTPLMEKCISLVIDPPLKVLVWEDESSPV